MDTLFGLERGEEPAPISILEVPFDATTSFRRGTREGPAAVLEASVQVDLHHRHCRTAWASGIGFDRAPSWVHELNESCFAAVCRAREGDEQGLAEANQAGARLTEWVRTWTASQLKNGVIPGVLGGDHSVAQGCIEAAADAGEIGVLHIDAHADLRDAYEGFEHSHASIFHNVLRHAGVVKLVQVGIRDLCEEEVLVQRSDPRVVVCGDEDLAEVAASGGSVVGLLQDLVAQLPQRVWVSFDIDGLDPSLCPETGTPVPGGLNWREAMLLLKALGESGRTIVGFDLCEVAPAEWDAVVGSRVLYQLCCWANEGGNHG